MSFRMLEPLFKKVYELLGIPKKDLEKKWKSDMVAEEVICMTKEEYENYKETCVEMNVEPKSMRTKEERKKPIDKRYKNFHQFFNVDEANDDDGELQEIPGKTAYKSPTTFSYDLPHWIA